jgi:2-phosphoglycerate kinase
VTDDNDNLLVVAQDAGLPFSKGLMAQALMATGLSPEHAYRVAAAVEADLRDRGGETVTLASLERVAGATLGDAEGRALLARVRQWQQFTRLERPLIVLIGGTTGVGKSTLATQVANRLGITRVASTDMVRQVMRAFFADDLMPEIHCSSFAAAQAVRIPMPPTADLDRAGFIEQTKSVAVGINAIIARAINENQHTIVEGVHVVPGFLDRTNWDQAVVLELVLKVDDAAAHRGHFTVREWQTGVTRPLRRYVQNFQRIRKIQKYILTQAARQGVTVLDNASIDLTVKAVMAEVLDAVSEYRGPTAVRVGG